MSFKVAISDVLIWNEALSLLPEEPVTNVGEQSLAARECRRWYKPVVAELLERHHWGIATRRIALAQIANDRSGEWAFAYQKPSDMAFPVKIIDAGHAWSGWTMDGGAYLIGGRALFIQAGEVLYSSVSGAVLEYTSFDIGEADFTFLFKRLVVEELAARICQPITKNATRQRELATAAEVDRQRFIAQDMNRSQPSYGNRPTESEMARFGIVDVSGVPADATFPGTAFDPNADNVGLPFVPDGSPPGDFYYEG